VINEQPAKTIPMYVAVASANAAARHISFVPYVPGVEAICGQPVRSTAPVQWMVAVQVATCPVCKARGVSFIRGATFDPPTVARRFND
jgi:hypothetical protein